MDVKMDVSIKRLQVLPSLKNYTQLIDLNCCYNDIQKLPSLPDTLKYLKCDCNQLYSLPKLPNLAL